MHGTFSYIYHKNQANVGTHTIQYMDSKLVYTQSTPFLSQTHRGKSFFSRKNGVILAGIPRVIPDISAFYQQKSYLKL